jgi:hypothetical protein
VKKIPSRFRDKGKAVSPCQESWICQYYYGGIGDMDSPRITQTNTIYFDHKQKQFTAIAAQAQGKQHLNQAMESTSATTTPITLLEGTDPKQTTKARSDGRRRRR